VGDKRLRTIVVSTRAALRPGAGHNDRIRDRSDRLLADLESQVIRDGGDPELLREIENVRRGLFEET
jgi:hypothetical protein